MLVDDDVVVDLRALVGARPHEDAPAAVIGHDDGVVVDLRPVGHDSAVALEQGDALPGVVVVNEVVVHHRVLQAVHIDAGGQAVVVDDVAVDLGIRDDTVATRREVSVHVDADVVVAVALVVEDNGPAGAVGHVNAMLIYGIGADVVFDEDVVGEASEDAPFGVAVAAAVAHHAVIGEDEADAVAVARHAIYREAVDHHVVGVFDVDAVVADRPALVDERVGALGPEDDRGGACSVLVPEVEPGVGSIGHEDGVARLYDVRRALQAAEGLGSGKAGIGVGAGGGDVVGGGGKMQIEQDGQEDGPVFGCFHIFGF